MQSMLRKGLRMKGEDINMYVVKFEELVRMASY